MKLNSTIAKVAMSLMAGALSMQSNAAILTQSEGSGAILIKWQPWQQGYNDIGYIQVCDATDLVSKDNLAAINSGKLTVASLPKLDCKPALNPTGDAKAISKIGLENYVESKDNRWTAAYQMAGAGFTAIIALEVFFKANAGEIQAAKTAIAEAAGDTAKAAVDTEGLVTALEKQSSKLGQLVDDAKCFTKDCLKLKHTRSLIAKLQKDGASGQFNRFVQFVAQYRNSLRTAAISVGAAVPMVKELAGGAWTAVKPGVSALTAKDMSNPWHAFEFASVFLQGDMFSDTIYTAQSPGAAGKYISQYKPNAVLANMQTLLNGTSDAPGLPDEASSLLFLAEKAMEQGPAAIKAVEDTPDMSQAKQP